MQGVGIKMNEQELKELNDIYESLEELAARLTKRITGLENTVYDTKHSLWRLEDKVSQLRTDLDYHKRAGEHY